MSYAAKLLLVSALSVPAAALVAFSGAQNHTYPLAAVMIGYLAGWLNRHWMPK